MFGKVFGKPAGALTSVQDVTVVLLSQHPKPQQLAPKPPQCGHSCVSELEQSDKDRPVVIIRLWLVVLCLQRRELRKMTLRWNACCSRLQMQGTLETAGTQCPSSAACFLTTHG